MRCVCVCVSVIPKSSQNGVRLFLQFLTTRLLPWRWRLVIKWLKSSRVVSPLCGGKNNNGNYAFKNDMLCLHTAHSQSPRPSQLSNALFHKTLFHDIHSNERNTTSCRSTDELESNTGARGRLTHDAFCAVGGSGARGGAVVVSPSAAPFPSSSPRLSVEAGHGGEAGVDVCRRVRRVALRRDRTEWKFQGERGCGGNSPTLMTLTWRKMLLFLLYKLKCYSNVWLRHCRIKYVHIGTFPEQKSEYCMKPGSTSFKCFCWNSKASIYPSIIHKIMCLVNDIRRTVWCIWRLRKKYDMFVDDMTESVRLSMFKHTHVPSHAYSVFFS